MPASRAPPLLLFHLLSKAGSGHSARGKGSLRISVRICSHSPGLPPPDPHIPGQREFEPEMSQIIAPILRSSLKRELQAKGFKWPHFYGHCPESKEFIMHMQAERPRTLQSDPIWTGSLGTKQASSSSTPPLLLHLFLSLPPLPPCLLLFVINSYYLLNAPCLPGFVLNPRHIHRTSVNPYKDSKIARFCRCRS